MQSTNWVLASAVVFLIGVALFAIGYAFTGQILAPQVPWPQRVDDSAVGLDQNAKIEMIERLGLVGSDWCEEILKQADTEEDDPTIRRAIAAALADCRQASAAR